MQCEDFEDRLNALLDERERPEWDTELQLHCESCAVCRAVAAAYGALFDRLHALTPPQAPADMADRVLAELHPRPWSVRRVATMTASLALAASVLLAVAGLLQWSFTPPGQQLANQTFELPSVARPGAGTPAVEPAVAVAAIASQDKVPSAVAPSAAELATTTGPGPETAAPAEESPSPAAKRAKAARATLSLAQIPVLQMLPVFNKKKPGDDPYARLAKQTGRNLAALILFVPGVGGAKKPAKDPQALIQPTQGQIDWTSQMNEGLQPLSDSMADALNLLFRALPPENTVSRS